MPLLKNCVVSSRYLRSEHGENHAAVSLGLLRYFRNLGFNPNPIWAESLDHVPGFFTRNCVDLLVLSGGETIGQLEERDSFELSLLKEAEDFGVPVLGICRGMQVILKAKGAAAIEISNHAGTRHLISGAISGEVNSFHNYGFTSVPRGFEILSTATDGLVEAVYYSKSNWLGIMWHPERESIPNDRHSREILRLLGLP